MLELLTKLADPIGIVGVILVLGAYFLLSTGRLSSFNMSYHVVNFLSAWCILFSLLFHWNVSAFIVEVAWIVISVIGMWRVGRGKWVDKE